MVMSIDLNRSSQRAKEFSDRLEDYIQAWLQGQADARFPEGLLPLSKTETKREFSDGR